MSYELDKAYIPANYEADIYQKWEKSGAFKPDMTAPKDPFTIIMPPLNANGDMHAGHGMYVIEDIATRYRRMQGHPTLWLPGTDHAAIETQVVYERLLGQKGQSRFDLGREEFSRQVLAFTKKNSPNIINQFRSAGYSADWSRLQFTLDPAIVEVVYETFKRLHAEGHVYRGNRIVNWCTSCRSSFADIEVKFIDREDALYTLDYGSVHIATTRPETIFGDAAVAVNPKDKHNGQLVGQTAVVPLVDRPVPIIADEHVDLHFGTGALKVTPAHDKNDYEIGLRHNLPEISIIDLDGHLVNVPEQFAGLTVTEARKAVVAALEKAGKLIETKPLTHSVGIHDRCDTVIEPLITEQWYVRMAELNAPVIKAFKNNEITTYPSRFKKIAIDWLENEHDWNISRQNWFGLPMPIFYKESNDPDKAPYLVTTDEAEAKAYYGEGNYRAETDVFDTWFSSGQWAYATLMASGDFDRGFFPTSVMMSGRDILTKWITRMTMFSLYRTGQVPFKDVYLWGMVNDAHGKKMSKSKGNVLNPLEITAKYGTDALRLALTIGITPGNDGSLSEPKIEGYRNFCNKLWNVARFILGQLPEDYSPAEAKATSLADQWLMAKLGDATENVTRAIDEYRFGEAGQLVYSLLWDDFADWYIEASKVSPNHDLLIHALETILKLIHPVAPYVSEAIWGQLPWHSKQLIVTAWPEANKHRTGGTAFEQVREVVLAARALAAEEQLSKPVILTTDESLAASADPIKRLARAGAVRLVEQGSGLYLGTSTPVWIEASAELIEARKHRLQAQQAEKQTYLKGLEAKLANTRYIESAPAAIVQETRDRHAETLQLLTRIDEQLAALA